MTNKDAFEGDTSSLAATTVASTSTDSAPSLSSKSIPALVEKFVIRLPNGLRTQIKELSENNRRSMNSEIIMVLEKHLQENQTVDLEDLTNDPIDVSDEELKSLELNKKLGSLSSEKKEALLELLG